MAYNVLLLVKLNEHSGSMVNMKVTNRKCERCLENRKGLEAEVDTCLNMMHRLCHSKNGNLITI